MMNAREVRDAQEIIDQAEANGVDMTNVNDDFKETLTKSCSHCIHNKKCAVRRDLIAIKTMFAKKYEQELIKDGQPPIFVDALAMVCPDYLRPQA